METLVGRLNWEPMPDRIRVRIPAWLSWKSDLISRLMLILWLSIFTGHAGDEIIFPHYSGALHVEHALMQSFIPLLLLLLLLCLLVTSTVIALDRRYMTIEYWAFGFRWWRRPIQAHLLHYLRLAAPPGSCLRDTPSKRIQVQIDRDYRTCVLAIRLTEPEAEALIAVMMKAYPFPKYLPAESATEAEAT